MSLWAGDAFSDYCGLGLKTSWKWVFAFSRTALEGHFRLKQHLCQQSTVLGSCKPLGSEMALESSQGVTVGLRKE